MTSKPELLLKIKLLEKENNDTCENCTDPIFANAYRLVVMKETKIIDEWNIVCRSCLFEIISDHIHEMNGELV